MKIEYQEVYPALDTVDFPSLWAWDGSRSKILLLSPKVGVWITGPNKGKVTSDFEGGLGEPFKRVRGKVTFEF